MSFAKAVKKSGMIDRLEYQFEVLQQVEIRQMLALACYDAMVGGLPQNLLEAVNKDFQGKSFSSREEMWKSLSAVAKTHWSELEFQAAAAELDARKAQESAAVESSPDTLAPAAEATQPFSFYTPGSK